MTKDSQSIDIAAVALLTQHLNFQPVEGAGSRLAQMDQAVAHLSDSELDAYIRYFGQAGADETSKASEILTGLLLQRLERQLPRSP